MAVQQPHTRRTDPPTDKKVTGKETWDAELIWHVDKSSTFCLALELRTLVLTCFSWVWALVLVFLCVCEILYLTDLAGAHQLTGHSVVYKFVVSLLSSAGNTHTCQAHHRMCGHSLCTCIRLQIWVSQNENHWSMSMHGQHATYFSIFYSTSHKMGNLLLRLWYPPRVQVL